MQKNVEEDMFDFITHSKKVIHRTGTPTHCPKSVIAVVLRSDVRVTREFTRKSDHS